MHFSPCPLNFLSFFPSFLSFFSLWSLNKISSLQNVLLNKWVVILYLSFHHFFLSVLACFTSENFADCTDRKNLTNTILTVKTVLYNYKTILPLKHAIQLVSDSFTDGVKWCVDLLCSDTDLCSMPCSVCFLFIKQLQTHYSWVILSCLAKELRQDPAQRTVTVSLLDSTVAWHIMFLSIVYFLDENVEGSVVFMTFRQPSC